MICNIQPPQTFLSSNNSARWPGHTETRQIMMGQEPISTRLSPLFYCGHRALEVNGSMYSGKKTLVKDIKHRRETLHYVFHLKVIVSDTSMLQPAGSQTLALISSHINKKSAKCQHWFLMSLVVFFLLLLLSSWCPHRTID